MSSWIRSLLSTAQSAVCPSEPPGNGLPLEEGMSLSLWLQGVRANPLLNHRSTHKLPHEAEVVIIGSGLMGTLTAYELLNSDKPPKSVVVLESREFCSGATGRNAGHLKPDQWRGFVEYEAVFGTEQALKLLANEQEAWERAVAYIRRENVDCELWVGTTLDVAMDEAVAAQAENIFHRFQAAGGQTNHIEHITDREEAVKRSRINNAVSVFAWDASTLYPWKLTAHIMRQCLERSLNLQTWTPATSVTESTDIPGFWTVSTERGSITTPTVVHATNAYCPALLPEFSRIIKPTPHMCNKVISPRYWSGTRALQNSYGVFYPDGSLFTINPRCTADGIILFGGTNPGQHDLEEYVKDHPDRATHDSLANFEPVTRAVRELVETEFEGWGKTFAPGEGYEYSWSGIIGKSADGLPFVGRVPDKPGQWVGAGYSGHGMASFLISSSPNISSTCHAVAANHDLRARISKADSRREMVGYRSSRGL
ncbi:DAO-domain-containing protein [Mycena floridula]|nr:DAO-domain-containing protein [Mycena floridula]